MSRAAEILARVEQLKLFRDPPRPPRWGATSKGLGGGWCLRGMSQGQLLVAYIYETRRIAEAWARESERPVLIIACSKSKEPATGTYYRGWDIYKGPLWTTYRAWAGLSYASRDAGGYRKMPSWAPVAWRGGYKFRPPMVNVWIVSAKYGLMSQFRNIKPYDEQLTKDNFSAFVKLLKSQLKSGVEDEAIPPLRSISALKSRRIYFAGPKIYAEALEAAGLTIERLGGKGWGGMRKNLRAWLESQDDGRGPAIGKTIGSGPGSQKSIDFYPLEKT